ncbi:ABC transporter ATP-binding protein [Paraburkholderia sp. 35.1]|uniref:ABC transporter ATP-binding protein n=1 Tax=Paraburkholderia sp. 35.1 TaxID=2991058 RepID=UPI003D2357D6
MKIELRDISISYGKRAVMQSISLTAMPGDVTAIVGPNGCGKTSVLRAIAGLAAYSGQLLFDGRALDRPPKKSNRSLVSYVAQDSAGRSSLTVLEVVLLGRLATLGLRVTEVDKHVVCEVLAELGILHLAQRFLVELSGGQRQLVFIAQALARNPAALLLDEPTSALDIYHQLHVLEVVRRTTQKRGLATVIVLHDLNAAIRYADQVAVLREGHMLACGKPEEIVRPDVVGPVFRVEMVSLPGAGNYPTLVATGPVHGSQGAASPT